MQTILFIDTSNNKEVVVGLRVDGVEHLLQQQQDRKKGQVILPLVEKLLKDNGLVLEDISEIQVNPGPGSFTGLRVGITIANTLGMLLKIPVNGKKAEEAAY